MVAAAAAGVDAGGSSPLLKSEALLNESVGAGYIDRHWPPAFKATGASPLTSLRQSFLNGALTRLIDPDKVLRHKLVEFVESGDFGLASGANHDGGDERLWLAEPVRPEEVAFETDVFLLTKARAQRLREPREPKPPRSEPPSGPDPQPGPDPEPQRTKLRPPGTVPREVWNRLGTRLQPKLSAGDELTIGVDFSVNFSSRMTHHVQTNLTQILDDLQLTNRIRIAVSESSGCEHRNQIQ